MLDPQTLCQNMPQGVVVICYVGYIIFEWVMGKTKFGSSIGLLVEHPISTIYGWIKGGPKNEP